MSNHWFESAPKYSFNSHEVIGTRLISFDSEAPNSSVILIGLNSELSNLIRQNLLSSYYHFNNIKILDAGNVRNTNTDFLIPIIREFLENGNKIVFLGHEKQQKQNIIQAFNKATNNDRWALAGESISEEISSLPDSALNKIAFFGHQIHLVNPKVAELIYKKEIKRLSLGEYRADYTEAEPFLRDRNALFMDINVTKGCELGNYTDCQPSGLTSEEVCQLTKYAGLSEQCNVLSIFSNYENSWTTDTEVCKLIPQYIWYYFYGMNQRREDRPDNSENIVKYVVQPIDFSYPLVFLKSKKTGRWWLEIGGKEKFVSISKKDYEMAKSGNISDRILSAISNT